MIKILILSACLFSSCSFIHRGTLDSCTQTHVVLSNANFKVIGSVSGYAEAPYFLFIPTSDVDLYAAARQNMISKADIYNFSKAIINITVDFCQVGIFPLYYKETCTIAGDVVVFLDEKKEKKSVDMGPSIY